MDVDALLAVQELDHKRTHRMITHSFPTSLLVANEVLRLCTRFVYVCGLGCSRAGQQTHSLYDNTWFSDKSVSG